MPRVYMSFFERMGWCCQFLEADLKTPVGAMLNFATPDKVIAIAERAGVFPDLEARHAMNYGIEMGRGGIYLELTAEQYQKLKGTRKQR
jgi:hypothetical protein